jgi:hypothetical protein
LPRSTLSTRARPAARRCAPPCGSSFSSAPPPPAPPLEPFASPRPPAWVLGSPPRALLSPLEPLSPVPPREGGSECTVGTRVGATAGRGGGAVQLPPLEPLCPAPLSEESHAPPPARAAPRASPCARAPAGRASAGRERDASTCPVSTEGWTRRVHFVREGGARETRASGACRERSGKRWGSYLGGGRDETCPVSTGGGTRRVLSVREGGVVPRRAGLRTKASAPPGEARAPRAQGPRLRGVSS